MRSDSFVLCFDLVSEGRTLASFYVFYSFYNIGLLCKILEYESLMKQSEDRLDVGSNPRVSTCRVDAAIAWNTATAAIMGPGPRTTAKARSRGGPLWSTRYSYQNCIDLATCHMIPFYSLTTSRRMGPGPTTTAKARSRGWPLWSTRYSYQNCIELATCHIIPFYSLTTSRRVGPGPTTTANARSRGGASLEYSPLHTKTA
ncbi:hypothetical protein J6590_056466 [Homalodisca vitripennis]|nr:hypothetical protein J6590_056466 [Homalodisca vitripennis]